MARIVKGVDRRNQQQIATPSDNDGKLKTFALIKLNTNGEVDRNSLNKSVFLLNPSSFNESKTSNWSPQSVPGQSDPIYQWVSGGPRQVTFDALVTRDSIHFGADSGGSDIFGDLVDTGLNVVGGIASQFAGVTLPPINSLFPAPDAGSGTQLSIIDKLDYYRSLMYPIYSEKYANLGASPPLVVMVAGRTYKGKISGVISAPGGPNSSDNISVWVVTSLNIKTTKMLPNLDPMEAIVSFTMLEYPIKPISSGNFAQTETIAPSPISASSIGGALSELLGGLF